LKVEPENYETWYKYAELLIETGEWQEGVEAYNQCIKLKPEHANAYYGKAKVKIINESDERSY
jgi:cytochrome c-type biogenesis protein CcmH/NrfG